VAIFNNTTYNRAVSFTPTGTGGDPVPPGEPEVTFGSLTVNNTSGFTNTFTSGTSSVFLDAAGAGPATISLLGNATSNGAPTSLQSNWVLNDSLLLTVDKTSSGSSVADVNINGSMSGDGGLIKAGLGTAVLTNGSGITKTYTGPTVVQEGRLRVGTLSGAPGVPLGNTSGVTVNAGAQLDLGTFGGSANTGSLRFGAASAPLSINGDGLQPGTPTGGNFGSSGAIRSEMTGTLLNNIVVQSNDATITVNGAANTLTLSGVISGDASSRLAFGGFGNAPDGGKIVLGADNTYAGGTVIRRGVVEVGGTADLGSGDVLVDGASDLGPNPPIYGLAAGRLSILTGAVNAIDDTATLTLTGDTAMFGGVGDGAPGGFVSLGAGVNEIVGGLVLGGITQTELTTYGSTSSTALIQDDRYFQGMGIVTLVPEPAALSVLALGGVALLGRRRRH
jgi:fibronectin-binding autotransporter adhesin